MNTVYTFRDCNYANYEDVLRSTIKEARESFDDFLDEIYEEINICGLLYSPSIALKNVDEIAYSEAYKDYLSMLEKEIEEREVDDDEFGDIEFEQII